MIDAAMVLVAVVVVFEALVLRHRLQGLRTLTTSGPSTSEGSWVFVCADGVTVDAATRQAAVDYAVREGLHVLDLIPGDLPSWRLMDLASRVDFHAYRRDLVAAESAGHAICVTRDVLEAARFSGPPLQGATPAALAALMWHLKRHASMSTDFVIAPGLRACTWNPALDADLRRTVMGPLAPIAMGLEAWVVGAIVAAVLSGSSFGVLALALFHLEPLAVSTGAPVRFTSVLLHALLRTPIQAWIWTRRLIGFLRTSREDPAVTEERALYATLLAGGTERFFEPRRLTCPLCEASRLVREVRMRNYLDLKPGRFSLDRCRDCGHVFQNPRPTLEGLAFYYRDYYEGLGERRSDDMFRLFFKRSYSTCAVLLRECLATPEGEALDVGCGHANFAWMARRAMPGLEVDGLDLSECVDLAAQRGWLRRGFRGQFTDLAPEMAATGPYDAVTMRHYLEHSRDPRAEIAAARKVLKPGGLLVIEVPNPDSRWRHLFRRYWPEWFQPQHLHLVPSRNMDRLLREQEFTPVRWQFGEAHLPSDFSVGAFLFLGSWVAYCDRPWLPPSGRARRALRGLCWGITGPVFVVTAILDALTLLLARSVRSTNVYRVVARKA